MASRTREQRRRMRRRLYFVWMLVLVLALSVLIGAAVRYGMYIQRRALEMSQVFRTEPVCYLPTDMDWAAYDEAGERYAMEQDPQLYALLYGQKKSPDRWAPDGAILEAQP